MEIGREGVRGECIDLHKRGKKEFDCERERDRKKMERNRRKRD